MFAFFVVYFSSQAFKAFFEHSQPTRNAIWVTRFALPARLPVTCTYYLLNVINLQDEWALSSTLCNFHVNENRAH